MSQVALLAVVQPFVYLYALDAKLARDSRTLLFAPIRVMLEHGFELVSLDLAQPMTSLLAPSAYRIGTASSDRRRMTLNSG